MPHNISQPVARSLEHVYYKFRTGRLMLQQYRTDNQAGELFLYEFQVYKGKTNCTTANSTLSVGVYVSPYIEAHLEAHVQELYIPPFQGLEGLKPLFSPTRQFEFDYIQKKDGLTAYNLVCGFMTEGVYHNALLTDIFV